MVVIFAINLSFSVYVTFNVVWCLQCPVSSVQCPGQKIKQNFKFSTLLSTEKKVFGYKDFFFFDDSYLLFFHSYHNILAISRFFFCLYQILMMMIHTWICSNFKWGNFLGMIDEDFEIFDPNSKQNTPTSIIWFSCETFFFLFKRWSKYLFQEY